MGPSCSISRTGRRLIVSDHPYNGTIGPVYEYEGASSRSAEIGVGCRRALVPAALGYACRFMEQR